MKRTQTNPSRSLPFSGHRFAALLLPGALCALALSGPQAPQGVDLAARVSALEQLVQAQNQRLELLETEGKHQRDELAAAVGALKGQSEAIDALVSSLDRAESAGFTAGINPKSREELLAGWRAYLSTLKAGLTGLTKPAAGKTGKPAEGQPKPR